MKEFGKRLKALRKENNLTLKKLAKETGISVSTLAKWENSYTNARIQLLIKLANYYQVKLDYILCRRDTKN